MNLSTILKKSKYLLFLWGKPCEGEVRINPP